VAQQYAPITLGQTLRAAASPSFVFVETAHQAATALGRHAHEHATLSCVLSGSRTYDFGASSFTCTSGEALWFPAGAPHSTRFGPQPPRGLMVEVRHMPELATATLEAPRRAAGAPWEQVIAELRSPDDLTPLALEALGLEWIVAAARAEPAAPLAPRWLAEARVALEEGFRSPPSLGELSRSLGVERSRLARQFRRQFGASIGQFVRAVRARRAHSLLTGTDLPLADVAFDCGFADQSHMTRAVSAAYGVTPGRLRAAAERRRPFKR
jgi:AraC family transcriptional regulator